MSFSCKNYDYATDRCLMLKVDCIPGRRGCVLEGRVKLSGELQKRVDEADRASGRVFSQPGKP